MAISEPIEDDEGLWTTIRAIPNGYREIISDFKHIIYIIRVPMTILIVTSVLLIYLIMWLVQGKFLYTQGWK